MVINTKNINRLIKQLKQMKKNESQYNAAQVLARGLADGSIQFGDSRFEELISGDLLRIVEGGSVDG